MLINRETVGKPHEFDIELLGDCDLIIEEIMAKLNWRNSKELRKNCGIYPSTCYGVSKQVVPMDYYVNPYVFISPNTYIFKNGETSNIKIKVELPLSDCEDESEEGTEIEEGKEEPVDMEIAVENMSL